MNKTKEEYDKEYTLLAVSVYATTDELGNSTVILNNETEICGALRCFGALGVAGYEKLNL